MKREKKSFRLSKTIYVKQIFFGFGILPHIFEKKMNIMNETIEFAM